MVYYNGTLYVFNQDHTAGAWNENHVVSSSMSAQIELLPDQIIEYVGEQGYNKTYIQATDPALDADKHVTTGDYWIKKANAKMTWGDVKGSVTRSANSEHTWNDYLTGKWADMYIGISEIYCRNASGEWIQVYNTDIVATAYTQIRQTQFEITQEAYRANAAEGELQSRIQQTADAITTEVSRATAAENSKIAKTSLYQDANSIVTAANNYTNGQLTSYSTIEQTSEAIELYVTNNAYKLVSDIKIEDAGIRITGAKYLKLNSGGYIEVNSGGKIDLKSGATFTVTSGNFSIDSSGNVSMTGSITSKSGSIGGWTIANSWLTTGSGASCVTLVGGSQGSTSATDWNKVKDYAFYAGASWPADAPFWVKKDGSFYASSGTFTGTVNATSGSFTGTVNATSGSFTGTVNATSGSFTGTVNATSGSFTGAITSKSGSIGSWNIADSWLYTGTGSTCVTLVGGSQGSTSTTDWNLVKDYAMYAGASWPADAKFRVMKDGTVYLNKLMVWDGSAYNPVDFSKDFSNAVSYSSGSWSGNTFVATLSIFGRSTSKYISLNTSINPRLVRLTQEGGQRWTDARGSVWVLMSVNGVQSSEATLDVEVDAHMAYDDGYEKALAAIIGDKTSAQVKSALESFLTHSTTLTISDGETTIDTWNIDASGVYSQGYTVGYEVGSPYGAVAIGARTIGTTYTATVTKRDGTTVLTVANCSTPYNDGVAAGEGKFAVHSGYLYTVDSHGVPTRYTGTLYDKIS